MSDELITTAEAADISGYHNEYIRRLLNEGRIKGKKFGPTWQVSKHSLMKYLEKMETKGARRGPKKSD
jgi:excisionase family DNA binding protein